MKVVPWPIVALGLAAFAGAACEDRRPTSPIAGEPLEIASIVPADGAVAVPTDVQVRVAFSEPVVVGAAVDPLRLSCGGQVIAAKVTLDSTRTVLSLVPVIPLAVGWDCRCDIGPGIRDLAGNVELEARVARFSTGLAFQAFGRLVSANTVSRDVSILDLETNLPIPGSPLPLPVPAPAFPVRLAGDAASGIVYVLYADRERGGVVAVDAGAPRVIGDSGLLAMGASDLAIAPESGWLFVLSP